MSRASLTPEAFETAAYHLYVNKYYALGAFAMLVYDTLLTLDREVEAIWKSRWSSVKVLFLFNRYSSIAAYAVYTAALHSTWRDSVRQLKCEDLTWANPSHRCKSYVLFPGIFNVIQQVTLGCTLILFTYAIFNRSRVVLGIVIAAYIAQIAVTGWSLGAMVAFPLPHGFTGCVWAGKSGTGIRIVSAWIMQLVFVSVVFWLMIWKAFRLRREKMKAPLIEVITKDGLKHFGVIFAANLLNVLTFSFAKDKDLRPVNATFSALITVLMINRMVLSVREEADSVRFPTKTSTLDFTPYPPPNSHATNSHPLHPEFDDTALDLRKITEDYELEETQPSFNHPTHPTHRRWRSGREEA